MMMRFAARSPESPLTTFQLLSPRKYQILGAFLAALLASVLFPSASMRPEAFLAAWDKARVVPENHICTGSCDEAESAHNPTRCVRSSIWLGRLPTTCSSRSAGLKSRISSRCALISEPSNNQLWWRWVVAFAMMWASALRAFSAATSFRLRRSIAAAVVRMTCLVCS